MALKNLLNTMKTNSVLIGELDRFLMSSKSQGSGFVKDERERGVWHPSSLGGCPRALQFGKVGIIAKSTISAQGQRIFDVGHHFGYMVQGYFYDMGILYGEWRCRECGHRWTDLENPSPKTCPSCEKELYIWYNLDYLEIRVRDEEYNITGHADALIKTLGKYRVVELKTIKNRTQGTHPNSSCFEDLSAPQENHLKQVNMYIFVLAKMYPELNLEEGLVIYGAKNDQRLKEFPIRLLYDLYVAPQLLNIQIIESAIADERVLPRPEGCVSKTSWDCRFCGYKDVCYSTESNSLKDYQ